MAKQDRKPEPKPEPPVKTEIEETNLDDTQPPVPDQSEVIESLEVTVETQQSEIERLQSLVRELESQAIAKPEEIGSITDGVPAELIAEARALSVALQEKYKKESDKKVKLPVAAQYAMDTWIKAFKVNPKTGAMQLRNNGAPESLFEKYFRRKLFS